jgi:hypothetical protein
MDFLTKGIPKMFHEIDKKLAILGNQGQPISSNARLALSVVVVIVLVAIIAQ